MNALVTGGAGFIGSHIVDALVERGYTVSVVDDMSTGERQNVNPRAKLCVQDVADQALAGIMDEVRPDVVFHHAAQMNVWKSVEDPIHDANVNVMGGINLYQNCVRLGVRRVIFASSGGCVYGDQEILPTPEDVDLHPESPYGIGKLANEHYLRFYGDTHGLESVSLRYANVYGPRQNPKGEAGVISIFMSKLTRGETPTIYGTGEQTRDYVHVSDVVAANLAALDQDVSGAFNVGTGVETTVNELYDAVRGALGVDTDAARGPAKPGEQMRSCVSTTKTERDLAWRPTLTLAQGLEASVEWFRGKYGA